MTARSFACLVVAAGWLALAPRAASAQAGSDEDVARRQLESGRAFVRQGNYTEALKDFRAVADTHGQTSVADNALLEIARYYLDVIGDAKEATAAVDAILKTYPTSDSAPDAYVMAGRLALAKGRTPADLDAALANFERVARLFPASDAVPRSLVFSAEAHWYAGRSDVALGNLMRVAFEYPRDSAAADAHLAAGRILLSQGDPVSAMEELQQVRNGWPDTPAAATALARLSIVHRLYVRGAKGPAFALSTQTIGPAKLRDVHSVVMNARGQLYAASEQVVTPLTPNAPPAGAGGKTRSLLVDAAGNAVALEAAALRPVGGAPIALSVTRPTGLQEALKSADTAVQINNGDWLVMDENERGIQRFARTGAYVGAFALAKVTKLVVNPVDEIAGIDRDQKAVLFYSTAGQVIGRLPFKGTGYELSGPVDLAYDDLGHLYVLDRDSLAVFSPFAGAPPAAGAKPAPPVPNRAAAPVAPAGPQYRLVTVFAEPQNNSTGLKRATAFALDRAGTVYVYDERAERVLIYQ